MFVDEKFRIYVVGVLRGREMGKMLFVLGKEKERKRNKKPLGKAFRVTRAALPKRDVGQRCPSSVNREVVS